MQEEQRGPSAAEREAHFRRLERTYHAAPVNRYFRPVLSISDGAAEIVIESRPDFHHYAHAVHASVPFKMMDDAGFMAANSRVFDVSVLTTAFQLHLLRPVVGGTLRCRAVLVHQSRRVLIADAVVTNSDGKEVARGTGTYMASAIPLDARIGYGDEGPRQ